MSHHQYFANPTDPAQRKYETIRAVVCDEQPMKLVAERFQIGYGTLRNWVSEFRRQLDAGQSPPLSRPRSADVRST